MGMKAETALVLAKKEIDKKISEAEINPIGLDSTLTDEKKAATASVVGEKITELKGDLNNYEKGKKIYNLKWQNGNIDSIGNVITSSKHLVTDLTYISYDNDIIVETESAIYWYYVEYTNGVMTYCSSAIKDLRYVFSPKNNCEYRFVMYWSDQRAINISDSQYFSMYRNTISFNPMMEQYDLFNGKYKYIDGYATSSGEWTTQNGFTTRGYLLEEYVYLEFENDIDVMPVYYNADGTFKQQSTKYIEKGYFKPEISKYVEFAIIPKNGSVTKENCSFKIYKLINDNKLENKDNTYKYSPCNFVDILGTQHGENCFIRIPSMCVMELSRTLVVYEVRFGSRNDEAESRLGYSIINAQGKIEKFGFLEDKANGEVRQINPQLLYDDGVVYLTWSASDENGNIYIHTTKSIDNGVNWTQSTILSNTTLNNSKIITSPTNSSRVDDSKILIPIYITNDAISSSGDGYYSGIMVLDTTNYTFYAKVCTVEGTNECCAVIEDNIITLTCRSEKTFYRYVFNTYVDSTSPFVQNKLLILNDVGLGMGYRIPCQESYRKFGNAIFNIMVTSRVNTRSNICMYHRDSKFSKNQFDFAITEYNKGCGGYSAIDCYNGLLAVCSESSYDNEWGKVITFCNVTKSMLIK